MSKIKVSLRFRLGRPFLPITTTPGFFSIAHMSVEVPQERYRVSIWYTFQARYFELLFSALAQQSEHSTPDLQSHRGDPLIFREEVQQGSRGLCSSSHLPDASLPGILQKRKKSNHSLDEARTGTPPLTPTLVLAQPERWRFMSLGPVGNARGQGAQVPASICQGTAVAQEEKKLSNKLQSCWFNPLAPSRVCVNG